MQDKITIKEIQKAVNQTMRPGTPIISIKGYTSNSGSVTDLDVRLIGKAGYHDLIKRSLKDLPDAWNPGDYDDETWAKAKADLFISWNNTLNGTHAPRNYKPREDQIPDPDVYEIRHLEYVHRFEHKSSEKETKSRPLTLAKRDITLQLPLGKYIGQLNLSPSKITSINAIAIESPETAGAGAESPAEVSG